jgi:uncharacterized membrane protein YfcA
MKGGPLLFGKFAVLGVVVGAFSSLFGVGGGIIMVPTLGLLFGLSQHMAQGVSLAVMCPTALAAAIRYRLEGNVNVGVAIALAVGSIPAAWWVAERAQQVPQATLKAMFALFMVAAATRIMPTASPRSMGLLLGMMFVAVGVRLMFSR